MDTPDSIQLAVQSLIRAANLVTMPPNNVVIRMMPKASETLQVLPCIIISPFHNIDSKKGAFDSLDLVDYYVEISLVAANNLDFSTNLGLYQGWHKAARLAIIRTPDGESRMQLDGVPSVWDINVVDSPTFEHSKLNQLYAYQSVVIKFSCYE